MRNFLAKGREIHVGKIETKRIMGRKRKKDIVSPTWIHVSSNFTY